MLCTNLSVADGEELIEAIDATAEQVKLLATKPETLAEVVVQLCSAARLVGAIKGDDSSDMWKTVRWIDKTKVPPSDLVQTASLLLNVPMLGMMLKSVTEVSTYSPRVLGTTPGKLRQSFEFGKARHD